MNKHIYITFGALGALAIVIVTLLVLLPRSNSKLSSIKHAADSGKSLLDYYQMTQGTTPRDLPPPEITFLAAGDIMLSRNIAGAIDKAHDPLLPFRGMDGVLTTTDFNFANLESPFSGNSTYPKSGSMVFNAPPNTITGLTTYKFKILNLANNHAMDQGLSGLTYTRTLLDQKQILHIGTGDTQLDAWEPQIVSIKGMRVGFVGASYASTNDGGKTDNDHVARIEDAAHLETAIASLKPKADFIVVTMHAGTEYTRSPNQDQIDFAHRAIDDGADVVIGAHPHWIQTTEQYRGKYIFYSLGNFIFDQPFSQDTKEGLTLKITLQAPPQGNPLVPGAYGQLV
jgi:poly-gamma-glutamate synthesis protein (capsule biosynthesis protein)